MILFNNTKCKSLTLDYLDGDADVRSFEWSLGMGELPKEWNRPVGYVNTDNAKLLHYTQGVPFFEETCNFDDVDPWLDAKHDANTADSWESIMGQTVHAEKVRERVNQRKLQETARKTA